MNHKDIKRIVTKQLKKVCPNWGRLKRKEKKVIATEVTLAAIKNYDFSEKPSAPLEELLGIEDQTLSEGILSLDEMGKYINNFYKNTCYDKSKITKLRVNLKDPLLKYIDDILNNQSIHELLRYKGFTLAKRKFLPLQFFRAELLKVIKYPEIAYRKYCTEEYMGMERKENKEFLGLPLHKNEMIDHTQLSAFRNSLSFSQITNLLVYILYHVKSSGILDDCLIHGVDSTDLANENRHPLCSVTVGEKKIRIYSDLDSDCGVRRNKRNKSKYLIGYRMHTLTAIDPKTGHNFPIASILASANHQDSLFLQPLIQLAQTMGVEMKLITADEAYHDKKGKIFEENGVRLIAPPSKNVTLPKNVDSETLNVTQDDRCEIPMEHLGCFENFHEFKCGAQKGECSRSESCLQHRTIPADRGEFQAILAKNGLAKEAVGIRKNIERPFNLLKHREGLENPRVRSQRSLIAKCAFATMVNLLIEMERRCNDREKDNPQLSYLSLVA